MYAKLKRRIEEKQNKSRLRLKEGGEEGKERVAEGGQDPDSEGLHSLCRGPYSNWLYSSPLLWPEAVAYCRRAPLHYVMCVCLCVKVLLCLELGEDANLRFKNTFHQPAGVRLDQGTGLPS